MRLFSLVIVVSFLGLAVGSDPDTAAVIGTWEGESKCTVPGSPCHDEQALYHFAPDMDDPMMLSLDAYKIVDGAPQLMGTIPCHYHAAITTVICSGHTAKQDEWVFRISGKIMTGRLTIGTEKTIYRVIKLRKTKNN
jgi:hypothetical protein